MPVMFPLPQFCSLAVTNLAGDPFPTTPTVTTRFDHMDEDRVMSAEAFKTVTGAQLKIDPCEHRPGFQTVTFTALHDCGAEACPAFIVGRVLFELPDDVLDVFLPVFHKQKSFLWVVSTPTYEGRAVVSRPTSLIATSQITERDIH